MARFDIVVVCHWRDLQMLRLQARSIARYVFPALVGRIWVVENDPDGDGFSAAFGTQVLPEYGAMRAAVTLVRRDSLVPGLGYFHGWRSQQVLKLAASRLVSSDMMLILDAKNHFIRPISADSYETADGALKIWEVSQRGHLQSVFANSYGFFGLDPENFIDRTLPNITPFPARPQTVRQLMAAIQKTTGAAFARLFSQRDVAEFYLLSAFIMSRDGCYTREYQFGPSSVVTVFEDKANPGAYETLRMVLDKETTLCFGVHWAALPVLPEQMRLEIANFWVMSALVENVAEGLSFFK